MNHPTQHTNHTKTILIEIIQQIQNRQNHTTIHNVRAHIGITGNEIVDRPAHIGRNNIPQITTLQHQAHTTPYWLPSLNNHPITCPI